MEKFRSIILDVWREACRHIELQESVPLIAQKLIKHIPARQLLIVAVDLKQSHLKTIAMGFADPLHDQAMASKKLTADQLREIKNWFKKSIISRRGELLSRMLSLLVPSENDTDVLAAPLGKQDHFLPILMLIAKTRTQFEARHIEMTQALLEPFTIAIENDRRLREMAQLREAAEADKKTLLVKLSRREMGDTIIGADKGLKTVMNRVALIAGSSVPVLIFGETGTGKELIARAIHNKSDRSARPFIRVNCGAIPAELIDSQLFGHERGSFTGAIDTRKGWFEQADGGTLFLDEVGEMPIAAQVRLLRILQDGWMERIGGKNPIRVDVRTVLATHRDLATMVADGTFREDLWYRISTFPIFLPPLRERSEDLKALAEHFAKRSAIRFGLPEILPTAEDIKLLASYSWPGNIRELGTVIDRAALLGNGRCLEIAKAFGWTNSYTPMKQKRADLYAAQKNDNIVAPLDHVVKNHIEQALLQTRGKIEGHKGAAALLKINPHTLRGRMRKLRIEWSKYR